MNIAHMNGDLEVNDKKDMETFIRKSSLNPFDDIWISGTEPYPCLAMLINGNEACVSYFLNDEGDMWQAVGEYQEEKETEFMAGGEKTVLSGDCILSLDRAIECANEFFDLLDRPTCVEWLEL